MLHRSLQTESSEIATEVFFRACQRHGCDLRIQRDTCPKHLASETRTIRGVGLIAFNVIELAVIELAVTCINEIGVVALGIHQRAAVGANSVAWEGVCKLIKQLVAPCKY